MTSSPFSFSRRCDLCGKVTQFERNVFADLVGDDSSTSVSARRQLYCRCGRELHSVDDTRDALAAEARELDRSGYTLSTFGSEGEECWAIIGPAGDRSSAMFAAVSDAPLSAARQARSFTARRATVAAPEVDVSALRDAGCTPQWAVTERPTQVGLRVWRGDSLAFTGLATGTPEECLEKALRAMHEDGPVK